MAKSFIQRGDVMDYVATAAVVSGQVVLFGVRVGVAITDIAIGQQGAVQVEGVWELAKNPPDNIAQGALLYWDNVNSRFTTTSAGNTLAGYAYAAAAATTTTVRIKLNS
jgi:predicted RecA/RadA family phage recombinase